QFLILLVGALVFAFYQYVTPPLHFDNVPVQKIQATAYAEQYGALEQKHLELQQQKREQVLQLNQAIEHKNVSEIDALRTVLSESERELQGLRKEASALLTEATGTTANDVNYIFLRFITDYLPAGLVGLLIAVILLACMGSVASAYQSLASTSIVDFYQRIFVKDKTEVHYVKASRLVSLLWGIVCMVVAQYASKFASMIVAVNGLGSLFYGVILGMFVGVCYVRKIGRWGLYGAALSR